MTDFGTRDHYSGVMKGVVLGICPDVTLVDGTHDHAAYTRVVQLTVVPVGLRGESQRCSSKKLGERVCFTADRFDVVEFRGQPSGVALLDGAPIEPAEGRSDCKQPCPSAPEIDDFLARSADLAGRWFLALETKGVDLFRTPAACAAANTRPASTKVRRTSRHGRGRTSNQASSVVPSTSSMATNTSDATVPAS